MIMNFKYRQMWPYTMNAITIVVVMVAIYARVLSASFISFDDSVYVVDNPVINQGFSVEGVFAICSIKQKSGPYWHPLTSLSHMMDCSLFGLDPAMHHMMNLVFHGLNTLILAFLLLYLTGERRKSLWVAAIFALHPLNVETVAWISERKNLLATLFFLLGIATYARYAARKVPEHYMILLVLFLLGLMCKPIMMTFPFTLFLILFWPLYGYDLSGSSLNVFFRKNRGQLYPIFGLILILLFLFFLVFYLGGNTSSQASLAYRPLGLRLANMLVADVRYLVNVVWPVNLSVYNPYPETLPWFFATGSFVLLAGISYSAVKYARRWPFLFVGWFWYLGNLITASGLLQQGYFPSHADRFTYLPMIGIFIIMAWGIPLVFRAMRWNRRVLVACAYGVLFVLSMVTFKQTAYWKNGITLFDHAVSVHPDDVVSMTNLALALGEDGQLDRAVVVSKRALELEPNYAEALNNLGTLYAKKGFVCKALGLFERAVSIFPGFDLARANREKAKNTLDTYRQNENVLRKALNKDPNSVDLASSLARVLVLQNKFDQAEFLYLEMYDAHPESGVSISYNLACLHARAGHGDKALAWLETCFSKGFSAWDHLAGDPDLDMIRDLDKYKAMVTRYKKQNRK